MKIKKLQIRELPDGIVKKLSTPRLLTLYRTNRKREELLGARVADYPESIRRMEVDEIKLYHKINKYCKKMKQILDGREHVA